MKKSTALKTLGLHEGATEEEIKKAHRKLVIENHPDKFGQDPERRAQAEEKTKLINEARDVLLNHSWEPEYGTAGTRYGAPYSYDPFASAQGSYAARGANAGNPQAGNPHAGAPGSQGGSPYSAGNPFAGWPFETFVWTTWDAEGNQHTHTTNNASAGQSGYDPFAGFNPFVYSNPFSNADPIGQVFRDFASMFTPQEPSWEEKLKEAKKDLQLDLKLIGVKLVILVLALVLSAPSTGLYLYTIISIGQGIWKRLHFLSLIFLIPFAMLAIIFAPGGNAAINVFALILFACSVAFDAVNLYRHAKRISAIKKHL